MCSSVETESWFPASGIADRSDGEVGWPNDPKKDRSVSTGQSRWYSKTTVRVPDQRYGLNPEWKEKFREDVCALYAVPGAGMKDRPDRGLGIIMATLLSESRFDIDR
jgi:hypothetical protein